MQPTLEGVVTSLYLQNVANLSKNMEFPLANGLPRVRQAVEGKVLKYQAGPWFRDEAQMRAPGTKAHRGGYVTTSVAVNPIEYAQGKAVTYEMRRQSAAPGQAPLDPDVRAIQYCQNSLDLKVERLIADTITAATWVTATEDAEALWAATGTTNTMLLDINARRETIRNAAGRYPNALIIDSKTFNAQIENTVLSEHYKYTQSALNGQGMAQILKSIFDLDFLFVSTAARSSAAETYAGTDFTAAPLFEVNAGKGSAFLFIMDPNPNLESNQAFTVSNIPYETGQIRLVRNYPETAERQDVYEVMETVAITAINANAGFLWKDTHTT